MPRQRDKDKEGGRWIERLTDKHTKVYGEISWSTQTGIDFFDASCAKTKTKTKTEMSRQRDKNKESERLVERLGDKHTKIHARKYIV